MKDMRKYCTYCRTFDLSVYPDEGHEEGPAVGLESSVYPDEGHEKLPAVGLEPPVYPVLHHSHELLVAEQPVSVIIEDLKY